MAVGDANGYNIEIGLAIRGGESERIQKDIKQEIEKANSVAVVDIRLNTSSFVKEMDKVDGTIKKVLGSYQLGRSGEKTFFEFDTVSKQMREIGKIAASSSKDVADAIQKIKTDAMKDGEIVDSKAFLEQLDVIVQGTADRAKKIADALAKAFEGMSVDNLQEQVAGTAELGQSPTASKSSGRKRRGKSKSTGVDTVDAGSNGSPERLNDSATQKVIAAEKQATEVKIQSANADNKVADAASAAAENLENMAAAIAGAAGAAEERANIEQVRFREKTGRIFDVDAADPRSTKNEDVDELGRLFSEKFSGKNWKLGSVVVDKMIDDGDVRSLTGTLKFLDEANGKVYVATYRAKKAIDDEAASMEQLDAAAKDGQGSLYDLVLSNQKISKTFVDKKQSGTYSEKDRELVRHLAQEKIKNLQTQYQNIDQEMPEQDAKELSQMVDRIVSESTYKTFKKAAEVQAAKLANMKLASHTGKLDPLKNARNEVKKIPNTFMGASISMQQIGDVPASLANAFEQLRKSKESVMDAWDSANITSDEKINRLNTFRDSLNKFNAELGNTKRLNAVKGKADALFEGLSKTDLTDDAKKMLASYRAQVEDAFKSLRDGSANIQAAAAAQGNAVEQSTGQQKKSIAELCDEIEEYFRLTKDVSEKLGSSEQNAYQKRATAAASRLDDLKKSKTVANAEQSSRMAKIGSNLDEAIRKYGKGLESFKSAVATGDLDKIREAAKSYDKVKQSLIGCIAEAEKFAKQQEDAGKVVGTAGKRQVSINTQLEKKYERLAKYYAKYQAQIVKDPVLNEDFQSIMDRLKTHDFADISKAENAVTELLGRARRAGVEVQSIGTQLKNLVAGNMDKLVTAASAALLRQSLRGIIQAVKEIDAAMVELRKVSGATTKELSQYLERAKTKAVELGASVSDVVQAAAGFARLGYSVSDAEKLGNLATMFYKVGDDMSSVEDATQAMVSVMAAFNIAVDDAGQIPDKLNEVGNRFAISSGGLAEALKRSASALNVAGNSLDESLALITSANEIVQDPASVGEHLRPAA